MTIRKHNGQDAKAPGAMTAVEVWLAGIGLGRYAALFREHAIDFDVLPELTDEDLRRLGVALGDRKRLLKAIAAGARAAGSGATPSSSSAVGRVLSRPAVEAERRQLTVMFCDLVDFTAMSARMDPEDLRQVVLTYQRNATSVIEGFGGYVAQYLGDGVLAYFGYPRAMEYDPERAVRAGLGIVDAIQGFQPRLQTRIGIATGEAVVGESLQAGTATGQTPNLAARLQSLAAPDSVVVSASTRKLTRGLFECADLGHHVLKGFPDPVQAWRVLGPRTVRSRFQATRAARLTPLVGREPELSLLRRCWAQALSGKGQVVLLSGDAGVGKSRLVQALKEKIGGAHHPSEDPEGELTGSWSPSDASLRVEYCCAPWFQNSPLYPVIDHLQRVLGLDPKASPQERLARVEKALSRLDVPSSQAVPLVASLLSIPCDERYPPLRLTPQRQREKTLDLLASWLLAEARRQPLLWVVEDLQWADPSTVALLGLVVERTVSAPILTLLTSRADFEAPWIPPENSTQIRLGRLTQEQVAVLVDRLTRGKPLPPEVLEQVFSKTDGVPLFVEELISTVLESGLVREDKKRYVVAGQLASITIPASLQDSLMARLDRLAAVKPVVQLAAAIGRSFSYSLLQSVWQGGDAALQEGLAQLVRAQIIYQTGQPPQATYLFKHALIQDAAYQSLLKSTRYRYHLQIAQALEAHFPERVEMQPELLAQHYGAADRPEQAVVHWLRAGQAALQRSATAEAIGHFSAGLEVLAGIPEEAERTRHELNVLLALGTALMTAKGIGHRQVESTYRRAQALWQRLEQVGQARPARWGLWVHHGLWVHCFLRGQHRRARGLAKQILALSDRYADRVLSLVAHAALGCSCFYMGEFARSLEHLEQAIALYDPREDRDLVLRTAHDLGVVCLAYAAQARWMLGYPDQALARARRALDLAQQAPQHLYTVSFALMYMALVHCMRREPEEARAWAEQDIALAGEQGFPVHLASSEVVRAWASAAGDRTAEAIAAMHRGIDDFRATGADLAVCRCRGWLAEVYLKSEHPQPGLALISEALARRDKTGERVWEAEHHRIKGELLWQCGNQLAEAERCFEGALSIARRQRAKSLELRAAVSLARLRRNQGRDEAAHRLLAPVYGSFTEGFDTEDLKAARGLLQEIERHWAATRQRTHG